MKTEFYKTPDDFVKLLDKPKGRVRILALDFGTNCGVAVLDIYPGETQDKLLLYVGQWDLSAGTYDAGPIRFLRLDRFIELVQPDRIAFENVKFTPSEDLYGGKKLNVIMGRVTPSIEFLGGLKVTTACWAERNQIPAEGYEISQIKKFATGSGRASKEAMIAAANEKYGLSLDSSDYKKTGDDNIADAVHVCMLFYENYGVSICP